MTRKISPKFTKILTRSSGKKSKISLKTLKKADNTSRISSKTIKKEDKITSKDKLKKKVLKEKKILDKKSKKKAVNSKNLKIDDSHLLELGLLCDCTGSMSSWI